MTNKEFTRIKRELKPFQRLFLTVACLGLLSSCGGSGSGGSTDTATAQDATKQIAAVVPAGWVGRVPITVAKIGINQTDDSVITPYDEANKITTRFGRVDKSRVIVYLKDSVSNLVFEEYLAKKGWTIKSFIKPPVNIYSVDTNSKDEDTLLKNLIILRDSGYAKTVKPAGGGVAGSNALTINDPNYRSEKWQYTWNLKDIHAEEAWNLVYQGDTPNVAIGVVDIGMNSAHEEKPIKAISFGANTHPGEWHGMHVSGIISSSSNGYGSLGVAWANKNVDLYASDINWSNDDEFIAGFDSLLKKKVRVINISGGVSDSIFRDDWESIKSFSYKSEFTKPALSEHIKKSLITMDAIQSLVEKYESQDPSYSVIFVQAAGNIGDTSFKEGEYPTSDCNLWFASAASSIQNTNFKSYDFFRKRTLIVGAYRHRLGESISIASYSTIPDKKESSDYGFIFAPGGQRDYASETVPKVYSTLNGTDTYGFDAGTSMAAPHVTGVAALVLQTNPSLSAEETKDVILKSADELLSASGVKYRALNAEAAVKEALARKNRVTILSEDFNGTALDTSKWTSSPCNASFGDPTMVGGMAHFGACQTADTRGKATVSGNKIVIEARFAGKNWARDSNIALVDPVTGGFLQIGDTSYSDGNGSGIYAYLYNGSSWEFAHRYGGSTSSFKEYRITIEGKNVTIQRGDSISNLTETIPVTLPRAVTGGFYYLRIGTGGGDGIYSPADFDWIRVTTDVTNPLNGHRYEVIDCGSWSQCQMAAVLRGGKLATIRSKAENDWIVRTLLPMSKNEWGLWIGYTDAGHEGSWTWDSGESASYMNWTPGEPNNAGGAEHYAHILNVASNPGSWNDNYDNGFGYVSQAIVEYSK